jgi:hypothetical protein
MNSPYRMPEGTDEQEIQPPIAIEPQKAEPELEAQEEEADNALIQAQQKVEEDKQRRADMRKQNEALGVERQRQTNINAKYKSVIENLDNLIKVDKAANVANVGIRTQQAKVCIHATYNLLK